MNIYFQQILPILQTITSSLDAAGLLKEINNIYLFGSRARGDAGNRSDIDLAIAAPSITTTNWLRVLEVIEDSPTLLKIDVIKFEEASDELKEKILQEGKIIYERTKN